MKLGILPRKSIKVCIFTAALVDRKCAHGNNDRHRTAFQLSPWSPSACRTGLKRHKHFHLHFIPTSSSWLNLVKRFFASITEDAIRRGVFKSVADLEATITDYLANHNATSKPFVWTKPADVILTKVQRARATLTAVKNRKTGTKR